MPPALLAKLDLIEKWSTGTSKLAPALASELRTTVRDALLARLDWFDPVLKDPNSDALKKAIPATAAGVSIEGATENIQNANPVVVVTRNARIGQMFSGLVLLGAGFPDRAGEALPRLDALVGPAVDELRKRVLEVLEVDDASLIDAAAFLLAGAVRCGRFSNNPNPADVELLNALLWADTDHARTDTAARRPEWTNAYQAYVAARVGVIDRFIAGVGAAQGTGAVHALDVPRLMPLLRASWKKVIDGDRLILPGWCKPAEMLSGALARMAGPQIDHWKTLIARTRHHLPEGVSYLETVDAIIEATKGGDVGLVKVANLSLLPEINAAARKYDANSIRDVEKLLVAIESAEGEANLGLVGTEAGADLDRIVAFLESSARWVDAGLGDAEMDDDLTSDLDVDLNHAVTEWFEILDQFHHADPPPAMAGTGDEELE